ncbi:hypothetical protein EPN87_04595 [archaeon]|nr:MAG: hypothetical protein EPN87_04595 [archaeon]
MELSQNLQDYCKSKEVDVEHNAVIWGKKFTNQEFYYENNKIDPSIENIRNTLGFENFLDVNNNLILQELFSFTLTNAWALFYIIVNKHQPNHKMTGLLCACLYSECEKMAKPLKIKLKKKLYWAKLFGITYETLNLRLRKLKTMQNL